MTNFADLINEAEAKKISEAMKDKERLQQLTHEIENLKDRIQTINQKITVIFEYLENTYREKTELMVANKIKEYHDNYQGGGC